MSGLPKTGDDVLLAVPQRERLLARVAEASPGWMELDLREAPSTPRSQLARLTLFVEFVNAQGVCRLHGRLEETEHPHLLGFSHKGMPQLLRRRENVHAGTVLPLVVRRHGAADEPARRAQTVHVSGTGMVVRGLVAPRVDERYRFELELVAADLPIVGDFTIERVDAEGHAHVRFAMLDPRDRSHIVHRAFALSSWHRKIA